LGDTGTICLAARPSRFKATQTCPIPDTDKDALEEARAYSKLISGATYLTYSLGLPLADSRSWKVASFLVHDPVVLELYKSGLYDGSLSLLRDLKLDRSTVLQAVQRAQRYVGGAILAISESIYDEFSVEPAADKGGLNIIAPDGIPLRFFEGIELYGQREEKFKRRLIRGRTEADFDREHFSRRSA
jgi:hypothetical protein